MREDFAKRNYWTETPLRSFEDVKLDGKDDQITSVVRLALALVKLFLEDVGTALAKHWVTLLAGLATTSLVALIPGVAGMIYRRAFWTWFTIAFAGLTAFWIIAERIGRSLTAQDSTADELAAGLSVFFVAQAAVVLFTSRLRRHSAAQPFFASLVPVGLYNRLIRYGLIAVGIAIVTGYISAFQWSNWWHWNAVILGLPFIYYVLKINPTWSGKARKNIVVCLDGTSNTPDQFDMGLSAQTNVFKLFKMLQSDPNGSFAPTGRFDATLCKTFKDQQVGLYYTGIGNKYDADPIIGTLSQATGLGASGIIERAYLDIMRVWRPGDRLYIFGFSRGAASARILSRMIEKRGAPKSIWSLRLFGRHWTLWPSKAVNKVDIDVLGCWDTVGSFGIAKTIAGINFQQLNLLHDLSVPENVQQAYHLVALDEDRQECEPTLMDPDPMRPERIVEVWFSGGHAGVGGGWATDRLSDVALDFMLRRISSGYCFDGTTEPGDDRWGILLCAVNGVDAASRAKAKPSTMQLFPDTLGELRTYFSNANNYRPRKLPLHAVLSETVFERMTRSIPVYAPQALFDLSDALDAKRELVANKVRTLEKIQSLDESEREKIIEFSQKLRLTRFPHYWEDIEKQRKSERPESALANEVSGIPALAT